MFRVVIRQRKLGVRGILLLSLWSAVVDQELWLRPLPRLRKACGWLMLHNRCGSLLDFLSAVGQVSMSSNPFVP